MFGNGFKVFAQHILRAQSINLRHLVREKRINLINKLIFSKTPHVTESQKLNNETNNAKWQKCQFHQIVPNFFKLQKSVRPNNKTQLFFKKKNQVF